MQPVDFKELALSIAQGGATDDYAVPLGYGTAAVDYPGAYTGAKHPKFPGDSAYENGPMVLKIFGEDLSQELIDAENRSFRDAIKHYMPIESVARHQCVFLQGNFLSHPAYENMLTKNLSHLPTRKVEDLWRFREKSENAPHESLSLNFDDASRKSRTREYFTLKEVRICEKILKSKPEIYQSVFALQAGFIDYLDKLKDAFLEADDIPEPRKQRAVKTIAHMSQLWDTPNFAREIVPSICLAYYQRTGSIKTNVAEDFRKGYELGIGLGLFQHHVKSPVSDNIERHFNCPAKAVIGAVMARDNEHLEGRPSHMGAMLAMAHDKLQPAAKPASCPYHHGKI